MYAKWIDKDLEADGKVSEENLNINVPIKDNNKENENLKKSSEKDYSAPEYNPVLIAEMKCTTKWIELGDGTGTCEQIPYCDEGYELKNDGCEKYADSYIEYNYSCSYGVFDSSLKKCIVTADAKEICNIVGTPYELNNGKCYTGYLPYTTPEQCPSNHLLRNECYSSVIEADYICGENMKYDKNSKKCIGYKEPHISEISTCPEGFDKRFDGRCVERKFPQYKSAITYKCPKGYTLKWENEKAMCYYNK